MSADRDKARLVAILNMLASPNAGEQVNAAGMISRMAAAEKMLVADFLIKRLGQPQAKPSGRWGDWDDPEDVVRRATEEARRYHAEHARRAEEQRRRDEAARKEAEDRLRRSRAGSWATPRQKEILAVCKDAWDLLTEWEQNFITSLEERARPLSEKQAAIVEDLPHRLHERMKAKSWG